MSAVSAPTGDSRTGVGIGLALVCVLGLSFNLRPTAIAVGPLLTQISDDLGLTPSLAGLLTTMPALCFAVFGALSPMVAARVGLHRAIVLALVLITAGQIGRVLVHSPAAFLTLTGTALAGMAAANVLLPSLIKIHFAERIGRMTAVYSTVLAIGLTLASVTTVPIAQASGSWRLALGCWAITAAGALVPWWWMQRADRHLRVRARTADPRLSLWQIARTPLGLVMAGYFALQSIQAYSTFGWLPTILQSYGWRAAEAGYALGLVTGVSIPCSLFLPQLVARMSRPGILMTTVVLASTAGNLGILLRPEWSYLWAIVLAYGGAAFPIFLALIGLRSRTSAGTAALSGFTQSIGYLIAATGPFLVGLLREITGSWTVPLIFLTVLTLPLLALALIAVRPAHIEDQLRA